MTEVPVVLPLPTLITTPRMQLRLATEADAEPLNAAIRESFPELNPWMPWAAEVPDVEDTRAFCREAIGNHAAGRSVALLMWDAATGTLIGGTGYPRLDPAVPWFEIGYWCRTPLTGRGYVTEATHALTRHAFTELGALRVEIRTDDRNVRSFAIAERLGFTLEGVLRRNVRDHHGAVRDTRVYAMLELEALRKL